jgi:hypothetical protein
MARVSLTSASCAFRPAWEIGPDGNRHAVVDHISPTSHPWVNMLSRWDAAWYVDIARDGYRYEPGFPVTLLFFHFTRCLSGLFTHCSFSLRTITVG